MSKCFLYGNGGGTSLNFAIVGNNKPANPRLNTIWVNADNVKKWTFNAEPSDGVEGDICIKIGKASPYAFNALKKNGLTVYPLCAMQNIGGEWKYLESQIFQGQWFDLLPEVALFENGIVNTAVFGDYEARDGVQNFSVIDGDIRFYYYNSSRFTKLFDVTAFNRIELDIKNYNNVSVDVYLVDESGKSNKLVRSGNWATGNTISYDASEYTGKYYVQLVTNQKLSDTSYTTVSGIKFKA